MRRPKRSNKTGLPQNLFCGEQPKSWRKWKQKRNKSASPLIAGVSAETPLRHRAASSAPTGAENGVHFPPAESGQKGRRGAITPRAKCPPEPPVRALRGRFLLHPSPASAAGLCFFIGSFAPSCFPPREPRSGDIPAGFSSPRPVFPFLSPETTKFNIFPLTCRKKAHIIRW